jgi:hypothetical protein
MTTRAELEKENADLRARLAKYEGATTAAGPVSFGMSEGVRADIENAKALVGSPGGPDEVTIHDGGTGVTYRVHADGVDEYPEGDLVTMAESATVRTDNVPSE